MNKSYFNWYTYCYSFCEFYFWNSYNFWYFFS